MKLESPTLIGREDPYAEAPAAKISRLVKEMNELTAFHAEACAAYGRILSAAYGGRKQFDRLAGFPIMPVRLFKEMDLLSIRSDQVVRTLTSSGTSGQRPSRIFLDKETATAQAHALVRIARSFLGNKRLPMLIVDHPAVLQGTNGFSARAAGILGFSQFGSDHTYALQSESLIPNWDGIEAFLTRHRGKRILLFGFTFIIWQHCLRAAEDAKREMNFGESILIHGGGWKKMEEQRVSNQEFKERLRRTFGIREIHNYYGMVEQAGSIYMECEEGFFHAADYSEAIVLHPRTLVEQATGSAGLIKTLSTIPRSYPGHILLTEDLGVIHGADGCRCGRRGTYFSVLGRLPSAELRGCSDTHQAPRS